MSTVDDELATLGGCLEGAAQSIQRLGEIDPDLVPVTGLWNNAMELMIASYRRMVNARRERQR